ncbi:Crp/Fnr family transcriptional regulator [Hymenobacter sp. GOD-10R]|uniref:Crp/Fnr family transcriptional regulator n=1 Tax=Hymenobacter sp. GOD-10R TaxID=3093922 RepID=UPI002D79FCD1|nr:Crp/Fnr family transcriptional regulator [Hymenobacter sp. GOD-10R]WRQ26140.1 Crp/Fnr family transcriptional regulator [Hymenobacter sp. GOD-10R]
MTTSPLDHFLLQFYPFTSQQLQLIRSQAVERTYPPGAYFSEAGRVAREIGFIVTGIFRVCYFDREGAEHTKYFVEENRFVVDLQSYQFQQPATEYVQAVTETHVLVFPASAWQELSLTIVAWPQVEQKLFTRALLEKMNRRSALVSPNGTTRYEQFLTTFPGLANRIPLAHLASYIGVTPQSLSRIRRHLGTLPSEPAAD